MLFLRVIKQSDRAKEAERYLELSEGISGEPDYFRSSRYYESYPVLHRINLSEPFQYHSQPAINSATTKSLRRHRQKRDGRGVEGAPRRKRGEAELPATLSSVASLTCRARQATMFGT